MRTVHKYSNIGVHVIKGGGDMYRDRGKQVEDQGVSVDADNKHHPKIFPQFFRITTAFSSKPCSVVEPTYFKSDALR